MIAMRLRSPKNFYPSQKVARTAHPLVDNPLLRNGEVPAAVVALVSPDAAEAFPDIAGYNIFRIPLSPRSVKSGADVP
jgi:hypothetical protein